MPNFILRRRNGFYFWARIPTSSISQLGREVMISPRTSDLQTARARIHNMLETFRTYVDHTYLMDREAFIEAFRNAVLEQPAKPSDDSLKKGEELIYLFSRPEFCAHLKANER